MDNQLSKIRSLIEIAINSITLTKAISVYIIRYIQGYTVAVFNKLRTEYEEMS